VVAPGPDGPGSGRVTGGEEPREKIATQRVLNDDTLQPGDIVSTDKGFFVFLGRSGTDEPTADFVPVTPRQLGCAPTCPSDWRAANSQLSMRMTLPRGRRTNSDRESIWRKVWMRQTL